METNISVPNLHVFVNFCDHSKPNQSLLTHIKRISSKRLFCSVIGQSVHCLNYWSRVFPLSLYFLQQAHSVHFLVSHYMPEEAHVCVLDNFNRFFQHSCPLKHPLISHCFFIVISKKNSKKYLSADFQFFLDDKLYAVSHL